MIVFSDKIVYDRRITSICLEELFFLSDACAADHSGEKEGRVMEAIFWLGAVIVLVIIEIATLGSDNDMVCRRSVGCLYSGAVPCEFAGAGAVVFRGIHFASGVYQTCGGSLYEQGSY